MVDSDSLERELLYIPKGIHSETRWEINFETREGFTPNSEMDSLRSPRGLHFEFLEIYSKLRDELNDRNPLWIPREPLWIPVGFHSEF